ncbi:MAG: hypothetical protein M3067_05960 [Chloroflexota bacterium]|nr:hypothetical protein [Chloroflexota bacterium]
MTRLNPAVTIDQLRLWAAAPRGRSWVFLPVAIAAASRIFSIAIVWLVNASSHPNHLNPFVAWDGRWYLSIAAAGYHAAPHVPDAVSARYDFAFFPLWPIVIKLSTLGVLDPAVTSVLLANLLFVAAAVLIWKLLAERFRPVVASEALGLLAFSPAAFVLSMAYSEPLFLVLAAGYFLSRAHPVRHAVLAALATATRIAGTAIVASAAVDALLTKGKERQSALLAVVIGATAFAAWWLYIALLTHDPLGFLHGSPSFNSSTGLVQIVRTVRQLNPRHLAALAFVMVVLAGALLVFRRDRELGSYAVVALALSLLPGGVIWSMPRYCLVAFPAFAGLAERLGGRGTLLLTVGFAVAQWFFVSWTFVYPGPQPP